MARTGSGDGDPEPQDGPVGPEDDGEDSTTETTPDSPTVDKEDDN